jgi:hypothetical protein
MTTLRIGDQVRIKGTDHRGEITGVGHTMILWNDPSTIENSPVADPHTCFIVRLSRPFILTADDQVVRERAPSSYPGCLFLYEIVLGKSDLELA